MPLSQQDAFEDFRFGVRDTLTKGLNAAFAAGCFRSEAKIGYIIRMAVCLNAAFAAGCFRR